MVIMAPSRSARTSIVTSSFAIYNMLSEFFVVPPYLGAELLPTFANAHCAEVMSAIGGWSQVVVATLYLGWTRWSGWRWTEELFEVSMRWRKRSCGTAGGEGNR